MGKFSRTKGAAAEREVVALAQEHGFPDAKRAAPMQCAGYADDFPDVIGVGRLHVEVKRRGKGSMYALAVDACRDRPGFVPTLAYREDRGPWLAVVPLVELLKLERDALGIRNGPALPVLASEGHGGCEGGGCCSSTSGAGAGCAGGKCNGGNTR